MHPGLLTFMLITVITGLWCNGNVQERLQKSKETWKQLRRERQRSQS
jgi:hypothetical protein